MSKIRKNLKLLILASLILSGFLSFLAGYLIGRSQSTEVKIQIDGPGEK